VLDSVTISNGLAFSPDGSRAYYVDTPTRKVDVFDHRDGALTGRRTAFPIADGPGFPDGLTVDAQGCVWVALFAGAAVHRYTPDGELLAVVPMPAAQVTACTFGGPALDRLFITTSRRPRRRRAGRAAARRRAVLRRRPGVAASRCWSSRLTATFPGSPTALRC
jgi:sugar lactone lactonase YvrE